MADIQNQRTTKTATIANGASLSGAIDLEGYGVIAIDMPAAWTAAALTFSVSNDGTTFVDLYDSGGTEQTIASAAVVASRGIALVEALMDAVRAHRYLKVRSGTSAVPVNQGAARDLTLVLIPAVAWA